MKKLIICLSAIACFTLLTAQKSFTYKFQDAATDPKSSRSYQIDVSKTNVHFLVFSGDKNFIEENRAITKDQYKVFIYNIESCKLKVKSETKNEGCTGGTSETIIITNKDKSVEGYVSHCGGVDSGNLKGEIEKATKFFIAIVPGFDFKLGYTKRL
jgi:hypothetical protein